MRMKEESKRASLKLNIKNKKKKNKKKTIRLWHLAPLLYNKGKGNRWK